MGSKVEDIKKKSQYLKGDLPEELANENSYVSEESYELLKFHGTYEQYDRDTATVRKKQGLEKEYSFMVRLRIPGGRLNAQQYLALAKIAENYANSTLKITTRETFQMHCIPKTHLKQAIREINETVLTTLSGCGDVVRNVNTTSLPIDDPRYKLLIEDTNRIAKAFAPKTTAYCEIWMNGENLLEEIANQQKKIDNNEEIEDLYGSLYMPRKFKIGVGIPEDNGMDILTNDLAIIAIFDDSKTLLGYNIAVGGGLGMTHNRADTYPRLASTICFVKPEHMMHIAQAVIQFQIEFGNRDDRKRARLKYAIDDFGLENSRNKIIEYASIISEQNGNGKIDFQEPAKMNFGFVDYLGWNFINASQSLLYIGLPILGGRILNDKNANDKNDIRTYDAIKEICTIYKDIEVILTADQNIILSNILAEDKDAINAILDKYSVILSEDVSNIRKHLLACVALPTCGKALAESERIREDIAELFEGISNKYGLNSEKIGVSISGCPNGCSRPYTRDIGIVGRMPGKYKIFIGGDFEGTRLNEEVMDKVPIAQIGRIFDPIFQIFTQKRDSQNESFGDFCYRYGIENIAEIMQSNMV